jgi:hypothetical protein
MGKDPLAAQRYVGRIKLLNRWKGQNLDAADDIFQFLNYMASSFTVCNKEYKVYKNITAKYIYCKITKRLHYVGFEVLTAVVMKSTIFWAITLCSPLKSQPMFRRDISPAFMLAYSSTLKMEAICSSET